MLKKRRCYSFRERPGDRNDSISAIHQIAMYNLNLQPHLSNDSYMSYTIPPEIVDLIIDYCHDDRATLITCSVICKAWLSSSRYHLFSTVTLNCRNFLAFLTLLLSQSGPSIGPFVQNLILCSMGDPTWFIKSVPQLSQHLCPTSLKLIVSTTTSTSGEFGIKTVLDNTFQTIVSLDIWLTCGTFLEAAELVSSFPLLETLTFNGRWRDESEVKFPPRNISLPTSVRSITLHYPGIHFIRWLLQHQPTPSISNISLGDNELNKTETTGRCLQQIGGALLHFGVESESPQCSSS